jgi:tRNA threonylcarbamoyladenosine biosynthesis protein TsaB
MKLLAFDTSTETMGIAVCRLVDGQLQYWELTGTGGAQASTGLIAGVLDLMQQAGLRLSELDAICFGSGPGSFTGLRTACAVAQGLAFGAGVPVIPVDSLLAVAEQARFAALHDQQHGVVTALLDARMDEMYMASFRFEATQWTPLQTSVLVGPEDFPEVHDRLQRTAGSVSLAGNVFDVYGARLQSVMQATPHHAALPTASAMLRLAPQLLAAGKAVPPAQALPSYVRNKVAKTTMERAAEKAAAMAAAQ